MANSITFKQGATSVLFWSVISAAFIGPGTVTTAASAGALFQLDLVWALLFATLACVVLQEAAARITIGSGYTLGEAIAIRFGKDRIRLVLGVSVIFGCAAYEAGNMLGAASGIQLIFKISPRIVTLIIFLVAALLLWFGKGKWIVRLLGVVVAFMGIMFISIAMGIGVSWVDVLKSSLRPSIPPGAGLLTIGLIGTTIVPYNLFLGSGISKGQSITEMRFGVSIAVVIGGLISMAILVVGSLVEGSMTFDLVASAISDQMGPVGGVLFGVGLFAAGITSALTAPLAAAITGKTLLAGKGRDWRENTFSYRSIWIFVLLTGFIIGISGLKPIPVIILAQAVNGFLLPFVAVFLLLVVNDKELMPGNYRNSVWLNLVTLAIVFVTVFLGLNNVAKAFLTTFNLTVDSLQITWILVGVSFIITAVPGFRVLKRKKIE